MKDDMTFRIIKTNPAKNTVTLRPTFGTIMKMNVAAAGVLYCGYLITERLIEDAEERAIRREIASRQENE